MNRHEIMSLLQVSSPPSLTITLPTHRTSPENRQDLIRLKNLVGQATERLLAEYNRREIEPLLSRLESLAADVNYRHTLDGLVLLVNCDFAAKYYLPFSLPERIVVADTFLTRDLVFAMNRTPRYWVLVLSEKPTRLYEGTFDTLVEIRNGGFPLTHEGPGGEQALPGGFGVRKSAYRDERHRQFFRAVDSALAPLMAEDPLPLAVVGVDRFLAFFNEVTAHRESIIATLSGSHDKTSPARLSKLVWPLVEAGLAEKRTQYLDELNKAIGERKAIFDLDEIWRHALEGRGRLLLVEQDYHYNAQPDETGLRLVPSDDVAAPDAVDDIIETVLSKQGQIVFTTPGQLPAPYRIAMVLRY